MGSVKKKPVRGRGQHNRGNRGLSREEREERKKNAQHPLWELIPDRVVREFKLLGHKIDPGRRIRADKPWISVETVSFLDGQVLNRCLDLDPEIGRWIGGVRWIIDGREFDVELVNPESGNFANVQYVGDGDGVAEILVDEKTGAVLDRSQCKAVLLEVGGSKPLIVEERDEHILVFRTTGSKKKLVAKTTLENLEVKMFFTCEQGVRAIVDDEYNTYVFPATVRFTPRSGERYEVVMRRYYRSLRDGSEVCIAKCLPLNPSILSEDEWRPHPGKHGELVRATMFPSWDHRSGRIVGKAIDPTGKLMVTHPDFPLGDDEWGREMVFRCFERDRNFECVPSRISTEAAQVATSKAGNEEPEDGFFWFGDQQLPIFESIERVRSEQPRGQKWPRTTGNSKLQTVRKNARFAKGKLHPDKLEAAWREKAGGMEPPQSVKDQIRDRYLLISEAFARLIEVMEGKELDEALVAKHPKEKTEADRIAREALAESEANGVPSAN